MTSAFEYNRKSIMNEAWAATHAFMARNPNGNLRSYFAGKLSEAWVNARCAIRFAREQAELTTRNTGCLRREIETLENTDTLGTIGINRLSKLRSALVQAHEHEKAAMAYAEKRALIASAGSRFCGVTFIKADGSERTMQVQPAALARRVKGDAACEAGKRAVATRKARHPNLLPVWDAQAKAPRSVNLATISRIAVDGLVHEFPNHA